MQNNSQAKGAEVELDKDGKFKDVKLQPSKGLF
jgi:hypothetical protein